LIFSELVAKLKTKDDQMEVDEPENRKTLAYRHSALQPSVEIFEQFIDGILADQKAVDI
jgi:hypothetical protein